MCRQQKQQMNFNWMFLLLREIREFLHQFIFTWPEISFSKVSRTGSRASEPGDVSVSHSTTRSIKIRDDLQAS